ncbi:matrixin family metalloprotease [Aurantimonas sp. DM33-3]|uniref:matrixin family metalloprotease n=1 Tax=Aurantimonas sp. DM33-3 TaxID=2766955 RepID=UPI0016522F47|nr:matrixin family metalloprotease [Aurantimonas sp. DM33-3]MBC6718775.1 matrixin family metalloprotease [Aurantimonas sp. DM33-3]
MVQVSNYQALLSGSSWYRADLVGRPVILTYSFETVAPAYFSSRDPQGAATIQSLSESEKAVVREALAQWASVSGVTFLETARHQGDLTFAFYDFAQLATPSDAGGLGYYPSSFVYAQNGIDHAYSGEALIGGDILFSASYRQSPFFMEDLENLALHEIGHALGLKHPFDVTVGHQETLTGSADNGHNTVMSYTAPWLDQLGPLDIAAAQHLYGGPNSDGSHLASFHWDPVAERLTQVGTAGVDLLRGTGASDVVYSAGGADVIYTAQGNDHIVLVGQAAEVKYAYAVGRRLDFT